MWWCDCEWKMIVDGIMGERSWISGLLSSYECLRTELYTLYTLYQTSDHRNKACSGLILRLKRRGVFEQLEHALRYYNSRSQIISTSFQPISQSFANPFQSMQEKQHTNHPRRDTGYSISHLTPKGSRLYDAATHIGVCNRRIERKYHARKIRFVGQRSEPSSSSRDDGLCIGIWSIFIQGRWKTVVHDCLCKRKKESAAKVLEEEDRRGSNGDLISREKGLNSC